MWRGSTEGEVLHVLEPKTAAGTLRWPHRTTFKKLKSVIIWLWNIPDELDMKLLKRRTNKTQPSGKYRRKWRALLGDEWLWRDRRDWKAANQRGDVSSVRVPWNVQSKEPSVCWTPVTSGFRGDVFKSVTKTHWLYCWHCFHPTLNTEWTLLPRKKISKQKRKKNWSPWLN